MCFRCFLIPTEIDRPTDEFLDALHSGSGEGATAAASALEIVTTTRWHWRFLPNSNL